MNAFDRLLKLISKALDAVNANIGPLPLPIAKFYVARLVAKAECKTEPVHSEA